MLKIKKAKGKLTLEDIRKTAQEYEEDYYGLVLKCIGDDGLQYYDDDIDGDAKCFIGIPQDWLLEEDKKAQAYMKERRHDGAGNDN